MDLRINFDPDWVSPPGDTIQRALAAQKISTTQLVTQLGIRPNKLDDLFSGRIRVTLAMARQLSSLLGASTEFWMARDAHYHEAMLRRDAERNQWVCEIPVKSIEQ